MSQLPPESATATALRLDPHEGLSTAEPDPDTEQWSRMEHLMAGVRDEIHSLRWHYASVHAGKQKLKWKPEPLPRPGVKPKRARPKVTEEQAERLFDYLRRTQGPPEDN